MSLVHMDSYSHYGTTIADVTKKYDNSGDLTGNALSTSIVRPGASHSLRRNFSAGTAGCGYTSKTYGSRGSTFIYNEYCYFNLSGGFSAFGLVRCRESATVHLTLAIDSTRHLRVQRDATVLGTSTFQLELQAWYAIQFKGVIHDSAGTYEVLVDGVSVLSGTGADTRNGGASGVWDDFQVGGQNASYFSDLVICDGQGSVNNDFLDGNWRINCALPLTDAVSAGANAGLTPSTGTDHGALVDETPLSQTDYNGSATVTAKDTYKFTAPSVGGGSVLGVQTNLLVFKTDAGAKTVCAVTRTGGADYDGGNVSPIVTTGRYHCEVQELDPDTAAAWVAADIVEFGMKVTA